VVVSLKYIKLIVLEMLAGLAVNLINRTAYTPHPSHVNGNSACEKYI